MSSLPSQASTLQPQQLTFLQQGLLWAVNTLLSSCVFKLFVVVHKRPFAGAAQLVPA